MLRQPQWVQDAFDLALPMAAAGAAAKMETYDESRLCSEALQYLEERCQIRGLRLKEIKYSQRVPGVLGEPSHTLRTLLTIASSPQATSVWVAFARFGTPPPRFVLELCFQAGFALDVFDKYAITTKDLKGAGARIRTLALKLAEELANPAIENGLRGLWMSTSPPRVRPIESRQCVALAELAGGLGELPKLVGQPNAPNARRLFFLRQLSAWVYKRARTPMRTQIYTLASVFFDMSDLTPQQLATLAPVRKRRATEPVS